MERFTKERRNIAREVSCKLVEKLGFCVDEIWLFGSVARGEDGVDSDIDIKCLISPCSLPTGYGDMPLMVAREIKRIEEEAGKNGYDVQIDVGTSSNFYEMLNELRGKPEPAYRDRLPVNVFNDRIVLYNSEELN